MGVTSSSLFRAMTCSKPPPPPPARPRSVRSYASAEDEALSTIIAEYESAHPVPPRPEPRALRRDARRADALRRIRKRLVQSVPHKRSRARYMERYFAHRCGDDVALYTGGFGEGPPTFIEPRLNPDFHGAALSPSAPGTPLASRLVSLDHLPAGATGPDLRDVALGRHVPRVQVRRNGDSSDGETDENAFFSDADESSFGDEELGFDPASFARRLEPLPPKTLARKRLDFNGTVAQHPESPGVSRWRAYCREEEEKIADLAAFALAERDAKTAMMRRHYAATLGPGFEDRYEPPPLPRWLADVQREDFEAVKRHAPWRRAAGRQGDETSSSEAETSRRSDGDSGEEDDARAVARRNRADRETRTARDAARAKARRRAERRLVKTENARRAAADTARTRLAAERAAAAAAAAAARAATAAHRWRRVRAVGKFIRRKASFAGNGKDGEAAEAT